MPALEKRYTQKIYSRLHGYREFADLATWIDWYTVHPSIFLMLLALFLFQRVVIKRKIGSRLLNVTSDVWQNLNKELLNKLMGDFEADVSKDKIG